MGLAPTLGNSPGQGDLLQSPSPARSLLNATFPHALASGGFGAGLLPVHSPLLRESLRHACFEHSNLFKVNLPVNREKPVKIIKGNRLACSERAVTAVRRTARLELRSNYELFNRNNFNIRYWSKCYRGCWHLACPPIDNR
ncbi:hypothetical protein JTE90_014570 [Oedothorax gibbosus]|uniref:Uncharacterized protein n=2 Tax=Oedothorax gibbosus TaxID=931172 RepID=A0AAV6TKQ7_9ARAC|nr:hypothetical protein JTE90_014570 [Oedothorax gibbosus]